MFEFLFKYPLRVFLKGNFVLLGSWPKWILLVAIVAGAALLAWVIFRRRAQVSVIDPRRQGDRRLGAAVRAWSRCCCFCFGSRLSVSPR